MVDAGVDTPLLPTEKDGAKLWSGASRQPDDPPGSGTVVGSVSNLAACAFGASMLSLPYAMEVAGPLPALALLIGLALLSLVASIVLVQAGHRSKMSTYREIVAHYMGPVPAQVAQGLILACLFVAAVSYVVGLADLVPAILPFTGGLSRPVIVLLLCLALYPLTLVGSLSVFGPSSVAACIGCYCQALALLFAVFGSPETSDNLKIARATLSNIDAFGILKILPMTTFVFAYHYVLTDTLLELKRPSIPRIMLTLRGTTATLLGCYLSVAIFGYILVGGTNIPANVLAGLGSGSVAIGVAQWTIALLLFATFALFIIPLRRFLEDAAYGRMSESLSRERLLVGTLIMFAVLAFALALTDLAMANALAGGCIALIMFVAPGILAIRMASETARTLSTVRSNAYLNRQNSLGLVLFVTGILVFVFGLGSAM